jgi:type II secretory ATPase GspE/PulE/Tfp pilus assembly ATPase PilB-like protein
MLTPQDMMVILQSLATTAADTLPEGTPRREREWQTLRVDNTTTAVQLVNTIFEGAIRVRATDIHIEPQMPRMRVRYRIDGMLFDALTVPPALEMPIISRIKILADMDITERRLPQDGHITSEITGQEYNMRVAVPMTMGRNSCSVSQQSNVITGLKQPGLAPKTNSGCAAYCQTAGDDPRHRPDWQRQGRRRFIRLERVNILTSNIVTIEDPVEYQLAGINQSKWIPSGSAFAAVCARPAPGCRHPDGGEIRDIETATVGVRAALTGQQLFSTLHTVDAPSAITTLENFGIQPYLIASALSGVVAQRLVRRVCTACQRWYTPSPTVVQQLGLQLDSECRFAYGAGCEECYYTGYLGRTGLFEILLVRDTIRHLIIARAGEKALQTVAMQEGMHTLAQSGVKKILQGITTPQEVMREVFL